MGRRLGDKKVNTSGKSYQSETEKHRKDFDLAVDAVANKYSELSSFDSKIAEKKKELGILESKIKEQRDIFEQTRIEAMSEFERLLVSKKQLTETDLVHIRRIKDYEKQEKTLDKNIILKQTLFLKIEEKLKSVLKTANETEKELVLLRKEIKESEKVIQNAEKERLLLIKQKKEIQDLIKKDSEVNAATEKKLSTLELYAKRMQRVYDKAGVHIDILSQFNIKRDNK